MVTYLSKASGKLVAPIMITPSFGLNLKQKGKCKKFSHSNTPKFQLSDSILYLFCSSQLQLFINVVEKR